MSWMLVLLLLQVTAATMLAVSSHRSYASWLLEFRRLLPKDPLYWAAASALCVIDRLQLAERLSEPLHHVHQVMIGLHGAKSALTHTRWFVAGSVLIGWGWVLLFTLLGSLLDDNAEMLVYGLLLGVGTPLALYKREQGALIRKRRSMLIELPEVLNQLMLLVGAGETVQQALIRIAEKTGASADPLRMELSEAARTLKMNGSFTKCMEDFSKRCSLQETTLFTTTLLLNYRRGGEEMLVSLRELSMTLWDKRKALAKTLGEEASSKLVFPMVLIFFIVMVIVAVPALLMTA